MLPLPPDYGSHDCVKGRWLFLYLKLLSLELQQAWQDGRIDEELSRTAHFFF